MGTVNLQVSPTWTQLADDAAENILVTWDEISDIEYAVTDTDDAPDVVGHRLTHKDIITRAVIGPGFLWARSVPKSYPATFNVVVTTFFSTPEPV